MDQCSRMKQTGSEKLQGHLSRSQINDTLVGVFVFLQNKKNPSPGNLVTDFGDCQVKST